MKIGEPFEKKFSSYTRPYFNIEAETREELFDFVNKHAEQLGHPSLEWSLGEQLSLELSIDKLELVQVLVRRYNMVGAGERIIAEKEAFLEEFASEAVKAIVYATDCCPEHMSIDQYVGLIYAASLNFGDSPQFIDRIYNLLNCRTHEQYGSAFNQVSLLKQLLFNGGIK